MRTYYVENLKRPFDEPIKTEAKNPTQAILKALGLKARRVYNGGDILVKTWTENERTNCPSLRTYVYEVEVNK